MWPSNLEVPPHEWPWCFNLKLGEPRVLEQRFEHKRDTDGISLRRTLIGGAHNPENWPKLTFDVVKKIYDTAQNSDISLRKAFIKLCDRKKLSDEQIEVLADAPDIYVAGEKPAEIDAREEQRAQKAKEFLAEMDTAPSQPARPKPREPVKA